MNPDRPIYKKLLQSYLLFAVIAIIFTIAGASLILSIITKGGANSMLPMRIIGVNGSIQNKDPLMKMGGWIEELSDEHRVIAVTGQKRTARQHYSEDDLLALVGSTNADKDYSVFYESKAGRHYLIYVPNAMNIIYSSEGTMISPNTNYLLILFLFGAALIVEAFFFSRYIYRKIQFPLKELTDAAVRTGAGARDADLNFQAEGEFITLRNATNDMIRTIAEQEEENKRLVDAQRRLVLELSHDFQTPIATINACASALEDDVVEEDRKKEYYRIIQSKADRVSSLTDDMLTLLKMEDSEYNPVFVRMDVCEFMRRLTSEYYSDIELAHLDPVIEIPEEPLYINADEKLLRRAVSNLLSNAIKYNRTGHQIKVEVRPNIMRRVEIRICDDGDPINPDTAKVMFDAFARDDTARETTGGTGLGLTIASEITEHHGGTISYQYESGWNVMEITIFLLL